MILEKIKNLNYLLIFLLILISFIGAAGLYSAADGSYQPWASRHLVRFYIFLLMAIFISLIDIKIIYKDNGSAFTGDISKLGELFYKHNSSFQGLRVASVLLNRVG